MSEVIPFPTRKEEGPEPDPSIAEHGATLLEDYAEEIAELLTELRVEVLRLGHAVDGVDPEKCRAMVLVNELCTQAGWMTKEAGDIRDRLDEGGE